MKTYLIQLAVELIKNGYQAGTSTSSQYAAPLNPQHIKEVYLELKSKFQDAF